MASDLTPQQRAARALRGWITEVVLRSETTPGGVTTTDVDIEAFVAVEIAAAERAAERRALERAAKVAEPHGIHHLFPATPEQRERQTLICETRRRIATAIRALIPPEDDTDGK